ncbi:MAG: SoxR reducing system RseC family protein [Parasulfuritortus sp.]|jgi:sigma-E factor negative regulatory protein RseC|nr:SoxR reducing system RseC family protein [Parasulfuritortus sp.]
MIETKTRIVSVANGTAWVRPTEDSGCGGCGSRSSCAVSGLAKYFSRHQKLVPVPCNAAARPGDDLMVSVSEGELLKAGLLAYLLPALLGVAGAATGAANGLGDVGAVVGMASGVALGLLIARLLSRRSRLRTGPNPDSISQGDMT